MDDLIQASDNSSQSQAKVPVIDRLIRKYGTDDTVVVAIGTAGWPDECPHAGDVVVGTRSCLFDRTTGGLATFGIGVGPHGSFYSGLLSAIKLLSNKKCIVTSFLVPPNSSPTDLAVHANCNNCVLSYTNVSDWKEFEMVSLESIRKSQKHGIDVTCIDTTLALIHSRSALPFVFVAGITDRLGKFQDDVKTRTFAQRYTASFNCGVVLAELFAQGMT